MSEEFEPGIENNYSAFWPLLILIVGLLLWMGYQDWAANSQRALYDKQFQAAVPSIGEAEKVRDRYIKLMKDLVETSQKDQAAADIVKAAATAGLIQMQPKDTNGTANPAAPVAAPDAAK